MSGWFPESIVPHNYLLDKFGDSPYYHVAKDIYDALKASGGHVPDATNPFATVNSMTEAIAAGASKVAWGRGDRGGFTVDNFLGVNTNGTYNGDDGFVDIPKVLVTCRGVNLHTDTSAGNVDWPYPVPYSVGFSMATTWGSKMTINEYMWISVGK